MSHPTLPSAGLPQAARTAAAHEARIALVTERERSGAARQIANTATANVQQAIANAARSTTVEFDYLVAQAQVESAMNPQARARTSSASGLYQFIESTWLDTLKRHGPRFGLGDIAQHITMTRGGSAHVADPAQRAAILQLRNDPQIASLMAAGLAEDNRAHLVPVLGRQPEAGELYLAHFLGAGGAGRFLSAMQSDPLQSAAGLFRRPAAANRAVFFEPGGQPRSLAGVMNYLSARIERAMVSSPAMPGGEGGREAGSDARLLDTRMAGLTARYRAERGAGVPYLIPAQEVFGPRQPPAISGGSEVSFPHMPASATLSLPGAPLAPAPGVRSRSMSGLMGSSFETTGALEMASPDTTDRIRRAYQRLHAMGL